MAVDPRWVAQRQAMARMAQQQAPPPRAPAPMGGPVRGAPAAPPPRGLVSRPSWQDVLAGRKAPPAPQRGVANGAKGLMGKVFGNPIVQGALKPLQVLDTGRRGIESAVREATDLLDTDPNTKASLGDLVSQARDTSFGARDVYKELDNPIAGFLADTAADPLTYVTLGAGRFAGGAGRLAAATQAAEKGLGEEAVARLARYGVSGADEATRGALGLEKQGLFFMGKRIPGTAAPGEALGRGLSEARVAAGDTRLGQAMRVGFAGNKDGLAATRAGLFAGTSENATQAVAMLAQSDARRAARGTLGAKLQRDAARLVKDPDVTTSGTKVTHILEGSIPPATSQERAALRKLRAFYDAGKAEANARGAQIADRKNYVPHVVSDAAKEAWSKGDERVSLLFDKFGKMVSVENPRSQETIRSILGEDPKSWTIGHINDVAQAKLGYPLLEDDITKLTRKWIDSASEAAGDAAGIGRLQDFGVAKALTPTPTQDPNAVQNLQAVLAQQREAQAASKAGVGQATQAAEAGVVGAHDAAQGVAAGLEREVQDATNAMPGLRAETLGAQRAVGGAETAAQQQRAQAMRLIPNEALQGETETAAAEAGLRAAEARTSQADLEGLAQATQKEAAGQRLTYSYEQMQRESAARKLKAADRKQLTAIENGRAVRETGDRARLRNVKGKQLAPEVAMGDSKTPLAGAAVKKAGVSVREQSARDSVSAGKSMLAADKSHWGAVEQMPDALRSQHSELEASTRELEKAKKILARSKRNTSFREDAGRVLTKGRGAKVIEVNPTDLPAFNEHISNQLGTYLQFVEDWQDVVSKLPEGASKEAVHQAEVHAHELRKQAARLLGMSEQASFGDVSDAAEEALRAGAAVAQRPATVLGGDPVVPLSHSVEAVVEAERKQLANLQKYQVTSEYHARLRAAEEWAAGAGVQLGPDTHIRIAQKVVGEQRDQIREGIASTKRSLRDFLDKAASIQGPGGKPKFDPEIVDLVRGMGAVKAEPYAELRNSINDGVREFDRLRKSLARKTLSAEERADIEGQREAVRQNLVSLSRQASEMLPGVPHGSPTATIPSTIANAWGKKLTQAETLLREQSYRLAPVRNEVTQILRDNVETNGIIDYQLRQVEARLKLAAGSDFGPDHIAQLLDDHLDPQLLMTNPDVAASRIEALTKSVARKETFEQRLPAIVEHFQKLDEKMADAFSPGGGWAKLNVPESDLKAVQSILKDPEYQSAKQTLADMEHEIDQLRYTSVAGKEVGEWVEKPGGGTVFVPKGTTMQQIEDIPAVSRYAAMAGLGKKGAPRPRTWEQAQRYAEGALEIRQRYNAPELIAKVAEKDKVLNEYLDQWAEEVPMRLRFVQQMKRERAATLGQWTNHLRVIDEEAAKADTLIRSTGASDHQGALERLASAIDEAGGRPPKSRLEPKPVPSTITSDELQAAQLRAQSAGDQMSAAAKQADALTKKAERARAKVVAMDRQARKDQAAWAKGVKDADDLVAKARANYDSAATLEMDAQDWTTNVAPKLERMWQDQVGSIISQPSATSSVQDRLQWADRMTKVSDTIRAAQGNPTHENIAIAKLEGDLLTAELDHAGKEYVTNVTKDMIAQAKRGKLYTKMVDQVEEGWVQLERSGLQVPKEVETALKNLRQPHVDGKFWEMVGKYNLVFKALATTTPGFHIRNALSATFMNVVDGVDFRTMSQGASHMSAYAHNPSTWTNGMGKSEKAIAEKALDAAYATGAGQFSDELRGIDELGGIAGKIANNKITHASRNVGHRVETAARYSMALDTLKKGGSFDEAVARIRRFHFDYDNIGAADEQIKKVIPFWMFASRNVPMQVQTMWMKPRWYSIYDNFRRNMALDNPQDTPQYITDEGGFKVGGGMFLSPDLPQTRVGETFAKIADPKRALADASPLFRVPAEMAAGKQFYNDIPFKQDDTRTPLIDESRHPLQGWEKALAPIYAATGQLNGQGVTEKGDYALKSLIPTIGQGQRLAPTQDKFKERQLASMASFLGIPLRQVGPEALDAERRRRAYEGSR